MLTVHIPTVPEAILELLGAGLIDESAAKRYFANFQTFQDNACHIRQAYDGQWVAALNGAIIAAASKDDLMTKLSLEPNWEQAYYENVGRIV
jgi:hypothetical protein